jgi:hypothetical protein
MTHKRLSKLTFTVPSALVVIALALAVSVPTACSTDPEQTVEPLSEKYTAGKDGKTYELTITQSENKAVARAAFTPKEGIPMF